MRRNIVIPVVSAFTAGAIALFASHAISAQNDPRFCIDGKCPSQDFSGYFDPTPWGRYTVSIEKGKRGGSVPLDMKRVEYLCADLDGCEVRMGMHDWDETQRIASREGMLFYNRSNRNWRTSYDMPMYGVDHDPYGTDGNGATQHLLQAWACYLTDGTYSNFNDNGDTTKGLSLLSWNQYNADCTITLID